MSGDRALASPDTGRNGAGAEAPEAAGTGKEGVRVANGASDAATSPSTWIRLLRGLFWITLVIAIGAEGAVDIASISIVACLLAAILVLSIGYGEIARASVYVAAIAAIGLAALIGVTWLQSQRGLEGFQENPAWKLAQEQISGIKGAVSIAPEQSWSSIVYFCPVLAFLVCLALFRRQREAMRFLHWLCYFNTVVAVLGIAQFYLLSDTLSFTEKQFYLDSLTLTFVNRNSAGTFLGIGLVMSVAFMLQSLRMVDPAKFFERLLSSGRATYRDYFFVAVFFGLGTIQLIALVLTQSRGAISASAAALVALIAVLSGHPLTGGRRSSTQQTWQRFTPFIRFAAVAGMVAAAFGLFSGRAAYRQALGSDEARLCTFRSVWKAIGDSWPYGTGFGNFANIFPAYRDSACSGISGVWEAAHNFYLEGLLGLGMTFAAVFGVFVTTLLATFIYGLRHRRRYRFVAAMGLAVLVLIGLHALVDFSLQIPGIAIFVAGVFAGCVTICFARDESADASLASDPPLRRKRERRRPEPEAARG